MHDYLILITGIVICTAIILVTYFLLDHKKHARKGQGAAAQSFSMNTPLDPTGTLVINNSKNPTGTYYQQYKKNSNNVQGGNANNKSADNLSPYQIAQRAGLNPMDSALDLPYLMAREQLKSELDPYNTELY